MIYKYFCKHRKTEVASMLALNSMPRWVPTQWAHTSKRKQWCQEQGTSKEKVFWDAPWRMLGYRQTGNYTAAVLKRSLFNNKWDLIIHAPSFHSYLFWTYPMPSSLQGNKDKQDNSSPSRYWQFSRTQSRERYLNKYQCLQFNVLNTIASVMKAQGRKIILITSDFQMIC